MTQPDTEPPREPAGRVVLLGASNLTRGLATMIEVARLAWPTPLDILVSCGHGRSYGNDSSVLGRELPGIVSCGLWADLQQRSRVPTAALVTDIGNDLVYGRSVDQILAWLEICLQRLADEVDRLVITRLPVETIAATPAWRFRLLSKLLFPSSRLERDQVLDDVFQLNQRILPFAGRFQAYVLHPQPSWYGWDPIHIRRARLGAACRAMLAPWTAGRPVKRCRVTWHQTLTVHRARPARWRLFGIQRGRQQPSAIFPDGTTLSLY